MSRTVKDQVTTGFRLAGGIVLFAISMLLLASGLDSVWFAAPPSGHLVWSAWVGWGELLAAFVLTIFTAHLWLQFFAGCVGFGLLTSVVVIFLGRNWYSPHEPFSRLEAAEMAVFFGATLVWLVRFAKTRLDFPDRIAIALYLFLFLGRRDDGHFAVAQNVAGLAALFLAWCVYRWKKWKTKNQGAVHQLIT